VSLAEEKAAARTAAFARRKTADRALAAEANSHLLAAVLAARGKVVSAFWPMRTEIDPRPAMKALAADHALCLPVVDGPGQPLIFRRWRPGDVLVDGGFGTRVPGETEVLTPETLIVPLAAFDAEGYRLGYGGGFYDRTLAKLRAEGTVMAIGFAYGCQEVARVPREATDQRLDMIVTEAGARHI